MRVDVTELAEFYERPIGTQVRRLLMHRIRARWRDVRGLSVMGLGFASPYLGTFRSDAARVASALIPSPLRNMSPSLSQLLMHPAVHARS